MRFLVLGSLEVADEHGRAIEVTSRRQRQLLAALIIHAGSLVSADRLMELIWGEGQLPAAGLAALRTVVARLRATIHDADHEAARINTKPNGYLLELNGASLDSNAFEQGVRNGQQHLAAGHFDLAVDAFETALALWRGDAYAEFNDEAWARTEASRLDELRMVAAEELVEAQLAGGRHLELVGELERLVAQHPLRERPRAHLMLALYRSGRHADALREYRSYRVHLAEEMGLEPSESMHTLELQILRQDPAIAAPATRAAVLADEASDIDRGSIGPQSCELPNPPTDWFGAPDSIRDLAEGLIRRRLLTLTGPGGVGKTRTAIEVGRSARADFDAGVRFVELAAIADSELVITSIASSMGIGSQPGMSMIESIVDWLQGRRLLLIIDNCEHVIEPVAELVAAIVRTNDRVAVLITSREPLGVSGEHVVPVRPLADSIALELFCDRALSADRDVSFDEDDVAAIGSICHRLDGIPLAIELVAARVRSASPPELLARLDDRFRLLRGTGRGGLERHQTLRATVAWSYQLLTVPEQNMFDRISVFAGSFDTSAVVAIATGGNVVESDVVDLIDTLVNKSMVVVERRSGTTRYRLLETMRQYGEERALDTGETAPLRDRHLAHYMGVAERAHQVEMSICQIEGEHSFDDEWDNLRVAHQWAIATSNLLAADGLVGLSGWFAATRMLHEHEEWAAATIRLGTSDSPAGALTYGNASRWAMLAGDHQRAIELGEAAIAAAPSPDHPCTALSYNISITSMLQLGLLDSSDNSDIRAHLRSILRVTDDPWLRSDALHALLLVSASSDHESAAWCVEVAATEAALLPAPRLVRNAAILETHYRITVLGDVDGALQVVRVHTDHAHQLGDRMAEGQFLMYDVLAHAIGALPGLGRACHRAIVFLYDIRSWVLLWLVIESAARSLLVTGQLDAAAQIYGHLERPGHPPAHSGFQTIRTASLDQLRGHPKTAELAARGAAMGRDELVAFLIDLFTPYGPTVDANPAKA